MPAMATKRLRESFAAPLSGGSVDRDRGLIRNVLICGHKSANGRSYPWGKGLTCDPAKYEGAKVRADHGSKGIGSLIGWLENVTADDQGRPCADLRINPETKDGRGVLWFAENNPKIFGLSHVAVCRTRVERGVEIIEHIDRVESVDLVDDPATTPGLREGKHAMPTTLRKFLEAVGAKKPAAKKWAAAKWVREMDDVPMGDMPPPEAAADADPADGITDAFRTAMAAVIDSALAGETDPKEALTKIKKMLAAHGDINGDGAVDAKDVDAATADADAGVPAMESVGAKYVLGVLESLAALKLPVTAASVKAVGHIPADHRAGVLATLAESVGTKPGETPRTTHRTDPAKLVESAGRTTAAAGAGGAADPAAEIKTVRFG